MKNGDVITLYETLTKINENSDLKFNVRLGYIMARNREKLRQEAIIIYDQRRKIVMEYGTINDNKDIIIPRDKIDEVNKNINDLMEMDNNVQIDLVSPDDFDDNMMNLSDIEGLMPMFKDIIFTDPSIND